MSGLRLPDGSPGARIVGLGSHLPTRIVGNDEIAPGIDSSDEWIRVRSGIVTRRFAAADESVADMAVEAGAKAVAAAGVDPGDVDLVIVGTCTHKLQLPGAAAEVATRIGAPGAGAVDVDAACASFCYGLAAASDAVRAGSAQLAVVIGSERFTNVLDLTDRGTAFLFGDGAGAAVVGRSDVPAIGPVAWGSDGTLRHLISQWPDDEAERSEAGLALLRMDGPAVYRWAVTELAAVARQACELAGDRAGRARCFRAAPGQPAHHRLAGPNAAAAGDGGHRPGRDRRGQHVGRLRSRSRSHGWSSRARSRAEPQRCYSASEPGSPTPARWC